MTRLQHPNLPGRVIDVPEAAVDPHQAVGWVPANDDPTAEAEPGPAPAEPGPPPATDTEGA